jgi:hypothetical protein
VPEREQRGGVRGAHPGASGQRRPQVRRRLTGHRSRHLDRQPAARHDAAGQHAGDRRAAFLTGEERLHDGGDPPGDVAERIGPPGDQYEHDRRAGAGQRAEQLLLGPRQPQLGHVAALARAPPAEQPGLVAENRHSDIGGRREPCGLGDARPVRGPDIAAPGMQHRRRRKLRTHRAEQGGHGDPGSCGRVLVADVPGKRVAAEERERVVGERPDDGDTLACRQRQRTVVGEQDDGLLRDTAGKRPLRRRVQVNRCQAARVLAVPFLPVRRREHVRRPCRIQHAELAFLPQHPGRCPVGQFPGHPAVANQAGERLTVTPHVRQFHVHARCERERGGLRRRSRDTVQARKMRNALVVRDHDAAEAELAAQQAGQQRPVRRDRHAVDVGVGGHHRSRARPDRHLERRQDHVGELPHPHGHRSEVAPGPGRRIAGEVLEGRDDPRRLEAADVGGADQADEIGVLADGLLDPAPPGVACDVHERGEPLVHAYPVHGPADGGRHLRDGVRVE